MLKHSKDLEPRARWLLGMVERMRTKKEFDIIPIIAAELYELWIDGYNNGFLDMPKPIKKELK